MEMTVFWDVAPCGLEEIDILFTGACCPIIRAITHRPEAVSTCEASVNFFDTTRRNIPEDSHLQAKLLFCIFSALAF
jgi:hypothetical protein